MAEHAIPKVDLFNPGQVFACLGFLEAADILLGDAEGAFDWRDESSVRFSLRVKSKNNPFETVIEFLLDDATKVEWLSPTKEISERDGGKTIVQEHISVSGEPKAADLPGRLSNSQTGHQIIPFGFWADGSGRFNTTFKKSTNGLSSYIRFMNGLNAMRDLNIAVSDMVSKPFDIGAVTKSLFRLDPRGNTNPIDAGTSPDKLRKGKGKFKTNMRVTTYPICEILAIIGLEHARPESVRKNRETAFSYCIWEGLMFDDTKTPVYLSPFLARTAINGNLDFLNTRRVLVKYEMVEGGSDINMTSITEEI